jgi:DNA/RNA endonuclease YhcR with UshA esterase domain
MTRRIISTFAVAVILAGVPALAHHAIDGIYDSNKPVTVEGVVTRFQFVHPHPLVRIEVKSPTGKAQLWMLEMDNRGELVELGFDTQTLKPGDRIRVTGSSARSRPRSLYIRSLERPADGFSYQHHQ